VIDMPVWHVYCVVYYKIGDLIMRNFLAGLVMAGACFATAAHADVILTDVDFGDIDGIGPGHAFAATVGGLTDSYGACPTCGIPGAALQIVANAPTGTGFVLGVPLLSQVFDPGASGTILSIDVSVDKDFTVGAAGSFNNSFRPMILQNGNYYEAPISLAGFTVGADGGTTGYLSFAGNLIDANFAQINTTTGAFDTNSHPDFTSGSMIFGISAIFGPVPADNSVELDYDNLVLDIHTAAVPEPLTLSLFGAGLVGVVAMRRRKKAQRQ
jgi:PEP-CTERM motif